MARTVRDSKLETRAARERLKPQPKPYWRTIVPGQLHLGYRRRRKDAPGYWLARRYVGVANVAKGKSPYKVETLDLADDFQDANGEHILSYAQAQNLANERQHAARGTRGPMTVADAMANYVKYLKTEKRTGDEVEQFANRRILPALGKIKIADLTTEKLTEWRDSLIEQPARRRTRPGAKQNHRPPAMTAEAKRARKATANRQTTALKAALNMAFDKGLVDDDLAWRRLKPFEKVHAARPGYLTLAEAKRLINAADRDSGFRALVRAALETGARYGELCALNVRDFHRGKIHVAMSKSGKPRNVVLTPEGAVFFQQLCAGRDGGEAMLINHGWPERQARAVAIEFQRRKREGESVKRDDINIEDDMRWHRSEQVRPMADACNRAKINPAVGIHQLRHTWASHAVMNDMPLMVVATNLGHADTRMVEKHYGHLTDSYIDRAIRASAPRFGAVKASNVVTLAKGG